MAKRIFGSVRRLPSSRWQARYRDPATNRLVAAPAVFQTKAEAARWLAETEADIARGRFVDPYGGTLTLGTYAGEWLEHRSLRPRTVELYRGLLDHHILPSFGEIALNKITPLEVRRWHGRLSGRDAPGATTVAKAYRLLKAVMNTAVAEELIVRNPCNIPRAATERAPERPVLSISELDTLADIIDRRYRLAVLLAAWCALRLGELLALTRADVDLISGAICVDKCAAELKSGQRVIGPPKTASGIRRVFVPPHVLPEVETHLSSFTGPLPTDLIFVGTKGQPDGLPSTTPGGWQRAKPAWWESTFMTSVTPEPHWPPRRVRPPRSSWPASDTPRPSLLCVTNMHSRTETLPSPSVSVTLLKAATGASRQSAPNHGRAVFCVVIGPVDMHRMPNRAKARRRRWRHKPRRDDLICLAPDRYCVVWKASDPAARVG